MSIRFECPQCGTVQSIYEGAVGRRIRCPVCNERIDVTPYVPSETPVALEAVAPEEADAELAVLAPVDPAPLEPEPAAPPVVRVADTLAAADAAEDGVGQPPQRKPIIFRPDRKSLEADMDMTPMVDVTFQLLIFFMLTASFTMQKSLSVPKPETNEASASSRSVQDFQDSAEYIVVRVDEYNTYHISAAAFEDEIEAPSEQELLVKLRQARAGDDQGNVPSKMLVVANGEALHERVVTAIDAGNDVGLEEVQLVTVETDE